MPAKLRVAIVGAGIESRHLDAYGWLKDRFEIRVLCSLDADRGKALCEKHGIADYSQDFDSLLDRDDIDVIDIGTPPYLHVDMTKRALKAGKHVICEKPHAASLAEIDELAALLKTTDRRLMPIFQYRYGTGLQKLKHLVESGLAGKPFLTTIETHWWRGPDYYEVPWRGKWATELGGGLVGHAIHAHDMLSYIHGDYAEVTALWSTLVNDIENDDNAAIAVRMRNGSLASMSMTLGSRKEISRLRFAFENVVAESILEPYTMGRDPWTFIAGDAEMQKRVDMALAEVKPTEDGYTRQFELFHEAVETGGEMPVTLADARRSIELATAIYHSAQSGQKETLPLQPSHPYYRGWLKGGAAL